MRAGVLRTFVEADSGDRTVRGSHELDAECHRIGIVGVDCAGSRAGTEQCLRGRRIADGE